MKKIDNLEGKRFGKNKMSDYILIGPLKVNSRYSNKYKEWQHSCTTANWYNSSLIDEAKKRNPSIKTFTIKWEPYQSNGEATCHLVAHV